MSVGMECYSLDPRQEAVEEARSARDVGLPT